MAPENGFAATTGEWADTHKPVVVAVDGSERNRSAVAWGSADAAAVGCEVVLITAVEDHLVRPPHFSIRSQEQKARQCRFFSTGQKALGWSWSASVAWAASLG